MNLHLSVTTTLALLIAAPVAAQQSPAPQTAEEDVVVTAQRDNQTLVIRSGQVGILGDKSAEDVPFAIKSYNSALILNQQSQTLGQVLENDPSIRTTYGFGNAAELFVVRGFALAGEDLGFEGLFGILPRQLVSPELYEQVQVLNGASAFLFGAAPGGSAAGGTINLTPKRANGTLTRVSGNYISDRHFGGSADIARRSADGRWGIRVNGAYRAGDVAVDDEFRRNAVVGAAVDFRGERVRAVIDLAYQRVQVRQLRPKVGVTTFVPRVPDADANYAQPFTYTTLRDIFGQARVEWDVADNALLYAQVGARDGAERGIYDGITVDDPSGAGTGAPLFVPRKDNNEAAQAGLRVRLAAAGITHEINFGASAIRQAERNAFDFLGGFARYPTNLYNPPVVPLPPSGFVGGDLDDPFVVRRTRLFSAFASDTIGLFDDRVLITAGLRLQQIDQRSYAANPIPPDATNPGGIPAGGLSARNEDDAVTPVVGIVVKPATGVSLYANRIEALRGGQTAGAFGTNPLTGAQEPVSNFNQVFPAFRTVQYEVGGKLTLGRINASLAAYTIELPEAQAAIDPARPDFLLFGLFGNRRNRGIELSVDGEVARGLRVIAGGTIVEAKLRDQPTGFSGNDAPGVPSYTANANVEWDLPFFPGFTLTGRVVQTGEQKIDPANRLEIPDWTRVDLGARYVALLADRPVTFRAGVDNVADRRFWTSSFDSFSQLLLQGAPRTYRASVTIDL